MTDKEENKAKKRTETNAIQEKIKIKNLLSILSRQPYNTILEKHFRYYFVKILGEEEVDRHIAANRMKETTKSFNQLKKDVINFAIKYFPENANDIISIFFDKGKNLKVRENLNEHTGSIIINDVYYQDLEYSMKPIVSFIGKKMYVSGTINIVTAPPGGGKSLFLMHEALFQAIINDKKVALFVVGDMDEYAVIKRMRAILNLYEKKYYGLVDKRKLEENMILVIENYGSITIYDIVNKIEKEKFLDFVLIDYDDNLVDFEEDENIYLSAARPYLVMDKHKHGKVVLFAAQGKPSSWRSNIDISVGFLAASSKKEHIADSIMVLKRPDKEDRTYYELYLLKDRHGLNGTGFALCSMKLKEGVFTDIEIMQT